MVGYKETHQGLLGGATQGFPFPLQGKGRRARDQAGSGFTLESSNQVSLKMHSKVSILAKTLLRGCLICEIKWSQLISSCCRWTELRETFQLTKHTLIHRVKEQGVISCGQSPSSAEVKWLLTLSTDLFIVCLLFLKESFHSHILMALEEFPAYMSDIILIPLTGALVEDR